jgi:hypothetical protein
MTIADTTKFAIGIVLLGLGAVILWRARGGRGFDQTKQAGALMLIAALIFLAIGLGYLDV